LNTNLKLSLQNSTNLRWNYNVVTTEGTYDISASRPAAVAGAGYDRVLRINRTMTEEACSGSFCK
jgi:hypothetical protein